MEPKLHSADGLESLVEMLLPALLPAFASWL